jgi:outer membrane protein assembly factor BamB
VTRAAVFALVFAPVLSAADWPAFRGPNGDGVVTDPALPKTWSATENVVWKAPVAGIGHSSPIISGGRVFLTAFLPDSGDRVLICFDQKDGKQLWQKTALTAPPEKMHKNNTPASATPAADGTHVFVTFQNGHKIASACYDFAGTRVWLNEFIGFASQHGFCGSPTLFDKLMILNGDSDGDAFLAGLDKKTGETVWKTPRPNRVRSFSTPLYIKVNERPQMVLAGSQSVAGFDPHTGKQLWVADSQTDKFVATVAYADGVIFATGTSPNHTLVGIRPDGTGNVTKSHVLWADTRGASYVPSPVAVGKHVFVLSDAGIGTLLEAKTGKRFWSERLGGRLYHASPLLLNDSIYCLADDGRTFVLKAGAEFDLITTNAIGEECHATPAVADGHLFIRSTQHVWCIGKRGTQARRGND